MKNKTIVKSNMVLDEIVVGDECNLPLDPSCIRFSYLLDTMIPTYDGDKDIDLEEDGHEGILKVTHYYKTVKNHSVESVELTKEEDIDRARIMLLGKQLADIVYVLTQLGDYQFKELLIDELNVTLEQGYKILDQYDLNEFEEEE